MVLSLMSFLMLSTSGSGSVGQCASSRDVGPSTAISNDKASGSCSTDCPQPTSRSETYPQVLPPLRIQLNCYSDLINKKAMDQKQHQYPNSLLLYRRRMGFSQKSVALLLDRHVAMLSRYER